jgi:primosomal protein N' (replication factor Y)
VSPAPTVEALAIDGVEVDAQPADVEARGWPRTVVVDRREEPPGAGLLNETLAATLRDAAGPVVCVLNRRGRLRVLACDSCHALLRWDRAADRPLVCDECGATRLRVLRAGVTRVAEELAALFPRLRVLDVDADTGEIGDADILIGTEAVLHRPEIRRRRPAVVAFLDFDQELLAARFRAVAQAHWLATRGAQLLVGRARDETRLVVQTRQPGHEVVHALASGRPTLVAEAELERRRALGFPPFGALAELTGDEAAVNAAADALRGVEGIQLLGPTDGHALVVAPDATALADALVIGQSAGRANGRMRTAVDPPRV